MTEYTSIRVTQEAKDAAEASKRDGETWNEYLQRCTANPPEVREYVDADAVVERLEGSKPLEDMAFDDWFEPDHAETIAAHINAEIATGNVTLDATERQRIAQEVAEALQN